MVLTARLHLADGADKMETTTIVKNERPDSIELNTNSKGDIQWAVKAYGDTASPEGMDELTKRLQVMKATAVELARKD